MAKEYSAPPAMQIDPSKKYTATIATEHGDMVVELFADKAPITVNNFVFLAKEGFYDGTVFHRAMADFMVQGGDPTGTGRGGPGYRFNDEAGALAGKHVGEGILSMANAGANTNGSQFFVTLGDANWLDGKHGVFGKVVSGLDALKAIRLGNDRSGMVANPSKLVSVTISES